MDIYTRPTQASLLISHCKWSECSEIENSSLPCNLISQLEELNAVQILRSFLSPLQRTVHRTKRWICLSPSWFPKPGRLRDKCRWKIELYPNLRDLMHLHVQQTAQESFPQEWRSCEIPVCSFGCLSNDITAIKEPAPVARIKVKIQN